MKSTEHDGPTAVAEQSRPTVAATEELDEAPVTEQQVQQPHEAVAQTTAAPPEETPKPLPFQRGPPQGMKMVIAL